MEEKPLTPFRKWFLQNKDEFYAKLKIWRENNKEKVQEYQKRYYDNIKNDPEAYQQRKDAMKLYTSKPEVKQRLADKARNRYRDDPDYRNKIKERTKAKYQNDPDYRYECLLRSRLYNDNKKNGLITTIRPYTKHGVVSLK